MMMAETRDIDRMRFITAATQTASRATAIDRWPWPSATCGLPFDDPISMQAVLDVIDVHLGMVQRPQVTTVFI